MIGEQLNLFVQPVPKSVQPEVRMLEQSTEEWRSKVPFPVDGPFDAKQWLLNIIAARQPIVFLHGKNPHVVHVRCHASWEVSVSDLIRRVWLMRREAVMELLAAGYHKHGVWRHGYEDPSDYAEVFYRQKNEMEVRS